MKLAKKRMLMELGMGTALRSGSSTKAAQRAIEDALWHNSVSLAEAFGFPKEAMLIDVEIAVPNPNELDFTALKALFPYGQVSIKGAVGGLEIPQPNQPDGPATIIANAAILVSFDLELQQ